MSTTRWSDVRDKHISAAGGPEAVRADKDRLLAQVRAHRLAEIRKRQGLTQREVAAAMGVSVGRVSQIESGDISGIDVLDRYVTALGGLAEPHCGRRLSLAERRRSDRGHHDVECSPPLAS